MMQIYGPHSLGFVFFYFYFFCFCNQSQAQTTTSMREKKKTQNKRRNEGLQDNEKHKSKTKQHKAESQGEAQISIMYLKWGHKQQMITTNKIKKASLTQTIPCHYSTYMLLNANNQNEEEGKIYWGERKELQLYYSKSNHTSPHFQKKQNKTTTVDIVPGNNHLKQLFLKKTFWKKKKKKYNWFQSINPHKFKKKTKRFSIRTA